MFGVAFPGMGEARSSSSTSNRLTLTCCANSVAWLATLISTRAIAVACWLWTALNVPNQVSEISTGRQGRSPPNRAAGWWSSDLSRHQT